MPIAFVESYIPRGLKHLFFRVVIIENVGLLGNFYYGTISVSLLLNQKN